MHTQDTLHPNPEPSPRAMRAQIRPVIHPAVMPPAPDLAHSRVMHESWRRYFGGFPAGARVLDIAAGIGALSLLAQEVSRAGERHFEVHSLDQAATLTAEPLLLDGIRFHARRYDRSTPFEDGYFDTISAQWTPPDGAAGTAGITELRRILRPGGQARLMYHALGSVTHEQCMGRIEAVDVLLDKLELLTRAREMFNAAWIARTALKRDVVEMGMRGIRTRQAYANIASWARHLMRTTPNPQAGEQVLQLIDACWEQREHLGHGEVDARLDGVENDLRAAQERMRAACALALDETRAHGIGKLFKAAGFGKVKVGPFRDPESGSLLAWDIQAA